MREWFCCVLAAGVAALGAGTSAAQVPPDPGDEFYRLTPAEAFGGIPPDLENWVPMHQLELEAHRGEGEDSLAARARAVPGGVSKLVPRASTGGKKVLGWHPYWATQSDIENYQYSNLTHIAYFSYEVNPTNGGCVSSHSWSTTPVVQWAHTNGVKVHLTATLFGSAGNKLLLQNATTCDTLIANLISAVQSRGGDGVCIDFETVGSWTGATTNLTRFMSNLTVRCHAAGLETSIALPSIDWYSDFDVGAYEAFGLDLPIIMGYDYHYSGSESPGPVAPLMPSTLWGTTLNIDYSTRYYLNRMTNAAHLMLAVPFYGRSWRAASATLGAASSGSSYSAAVTYSAAKSAAATYGRKWESNGSCPYYVYTNSGAIYQAFYDDPESLGMKYDLVNDKGMGGIGIWALTMAHNDLWANIAAKIDVDGEGGSGGGGGGSATNNSSKLSAHGVAGTTALLRWTETAGATEGYALQVARDADFTSFHYATTVAASSSSDFAASDGWVTNNVGTAATPVTVAGRSWTLYNVQVRPGLTTYGDTGYVYLTVSNSYIETPPFDGTVTQIVVKTRAAGTSNTEFRKATVSASTDGGTTFAKLFDAPAPSNTAIATNVYDLPAGLAGASGVRLRIMCTSSAGPTVLLHGLEIRGTTAGGSVPGHSLALTGLTAGQLYYARVRPARATAWSTTLAFRAGMEVSPLSVSNLTSTGVTFAWPAMTGATGYKVDATTAAFPATTTACPAAPLGTNACLAGQSWCYTGTVCTVTTSTNLAAGPGYSFSPIYAGHYLVGHPGQAIQSAPLALDGATSVTLAFSNGAWNAANSTFGLECTRIRAEYKLDNGAWNTLGTQTAADTGDTTGWRAFSASLGAAALDGTSIVFRIVAPNAERYPDSASGSLRGAGIKNLRVTMSGAGRYSEAARVAGFPKNTTAKKMALTNLAASTMYYFRIQAVSNTPVKGIWTATTATTPAGGTAPTLADWSSTPSTPIGVAVSRTVSASGSPAPTLSIASTTAAGTVALSGATSAGTTSTATLQYTPAAADLGTRTVTVTASNAYGTASKTFSLTATATAPTLTLGAATGSGFQASWGAVTAAAGYRIQLAATADFSSSGSAPAALAVDFEGTTNYPSGRSGTAVIATNKTSYSMSGTTTAGGGVAVFKAAGKTLVSPWLENPSTLTYGIRKTSNTNEWLLVVEVATPSAPDSWTPVATNTLTGSSTAIVRCTQDLSRWANVRVRFRDERAAGTAERYLDDIGIAFRDLSGVLADTTTAGTSYAFAGLSPNRPYYVRVRTDYGRDIASGWSAVKSITLTSADSNSNGFPDEWEIEQFGCVTNVSKTADSDGDGVSNWSEYIAGTRAGDATSYLAIEHCAVADASGGTVTLSWPTVPGRVYSLWSTTNLLQPFAQVQGGLPASQTSITQSPTSTPVFYLIKVTWPDMP